MMDPLVPFQWKWKKPSMVKVRETSEESVTKRQGVGSPEDSGGPKECTVMENANVEVSQMQTFSGIFFSL